MSTGRRGPYRVGRERREQILDAAATRFDGPGFADTTMTQIARDVGITSPTLSHYFPSKDAILTALADRRFERAMVVANEAVDDEDGLGVLRLMLRLTGIRATEPELMRVFLQVAGLSVDTSSDAHALYVTRYERVVGDIAGRLRAGVDAGRLRPDVDCEAVARDMIATSDGLQLQWLLTDGGIDLVGMMRTHLERIVPDILVSGQRVPLG